MKAVRCLAVVAVLCLSGLTGCGTGGDPTTDSTSTAQSLNPRSTSDDVPTRAEAIAFATAVNLKVEDIPLPGFEEEGSEKESTNDNLSECLKLESNEVADRESPSFIGTGPETYERGGSEVAVLPSPDIALEDVEALTSAEAERCLSELVEEASGSGVRYGKAGVAEVQGNDERDMVALLVESTLVPDEGESIPIYFDFRGFASGHAVVLSTYIQTGVPPDKAVGEELIALLRDRAEKYSLGRP